MKALTISLVAFVLSGCAGVNVSWSFTASSNTALMQQSMVQQVPKPEKD